MTKTVVDQRLNLASSGRYRAQWIAEGSFEVFVVFPRATIEILTRRDARARLNRLTHQRAAEREAVNNSGPCQSR